MTVVPAMTLTATDGKIITIGSYLSFEIKDVQLLYNTIHDATDTIDAIAASVAAEYLSKKSSKEIDYREMQDYVQEHIKLGQYGIANAQYFVTSFAVAKAYRFITGDIKTWDNSDQINMQKQHGNGSEE